MCTIGVVGSARFANKVDEKALNKTAGAVLIMVSVVSWVLSVNKSKSAEEIFLSGFLCQ